MSFFAVQAAEGAYAGGVYLEVTGKHVTECIGGTRAVTEAELISRCQTFCDPRLNAAQSLDLALVLVDLLKKGGNRASARSGCPMVKQPGSDPNAGGPRQRHKLQMP
jgi:3-deoxy-7-phosphoheptulonate synthase